MSDLVVMASFAAALFGAALVPGPAAAFCVAAGLERRHGLSLLAPAGVALGKLVHLSVAAVGAMWLSRMPQLVRFGLLATAATYMVVEGLQRWRIADRAGHLNAASRRPAHRLLWKGFVVSVANPQSLASSLIILPLFATADMSGAGWAVLLAVGALTVVVAYSLYELIAVVLSRQLPANALNRFVGATYMAAAAGLAAVTAI